ncbi:hypothetical protein cgR_0704 [Corynebacterium glutamicum R]|uniref:Uncharacterized protein n=1 Tax=Corynebacterium glutamicum (strain R) TaxID=340322 RepID=A0AB72V909_CORGB|nr:hypothetical protein cgR_0704 [Corynebacterium glutamicum R]
MILFGTNAVLRFCTNQDHPFLVLGFPQYRFHRPPTSLLSPCHPNRFFQRLNHNRLFLLFHIFRHIIKLSLSRSDCLFELFHPLSCALSKLLEKFRILHRYHPPAL